MNIQKGHIPRICFVILHYNAVNETIKCIESVLRQIEMCKRAVINIIVVDNGSLNESGRMLSEKYSHVDAVHILLETISVFNMRLKPCVRILLFCQTTILK